MKRAAILASVALLVASLNAGCVERSFVITSDPPGALVYRDGKPLGTTPVDDNFVYYGRYEFTLVRDKFETLQVIEEISTPWYEIPGIDFFSENLYPFKLRDVRRLHYRLQPLLPDRKEELLGRSLELRARGKQIGEAQPPKTPPQPAPPPPLPAPPLPPPGTPPNAAVVPAPASLIRSEGGAPPH